MPDQNSSKPRRGPLWPDEELLAEVIWCANGDTFASLARRLGMSPATLEWRFQKMGQIELLARIWPERRSEVRGKGRKTSSQQERAAA